MNEVEELLERMIESRIANEALRDAFLREDFRFAIDKVYQNPHSLAVEYERRAQRDQTIIDALQESQKRPQAD